MAGSRQRTAREIALEILTKMEEQKSYSNLEVNARLERERLSRADAGLVTELVYGTTQRRNTLDYLLGRFVKGGGRKLQPWVRNLLRLSLYQIGYLDRIPPRAAVHEAVEIAKRRGHQGIASLVNGVLRAILRQPDVWQTFPSEKASTSLSLRHSHPEWLVERWLHHYGEKVTEAICAANNQPPRQTIRVNRLKTEREPLLTALQTEFPGAQASQLSEVGILLESGNLAATRWFQEGWCTIQDESSMLVAPALAVSPGQRVLDACAAPGGKTTHLAEMMENSGEIIACDIHQHKRQLIEQAAARLGITVIKTMTADAADLTSQEVGLFDRILLDAPCSGFGVIRRKPDLKWNKQETDVTQIAELQFRLLQRVSQLLKPGGLLVYSTCTIEPEENSQLVERFVASHPEFQLDPSLLADLPPAVRSLANETTGYVQILPHHFQSDGFFIARIKRKP